MIPRGRRWSAGVAAAVTLVACQSGSEAPDAEREVLTAQVSDVQQSADERAHALQELGRAAVASGDQDQVVGVYREMLAATGATRQDYERLSAPAELRGLLDAVLTALDRQADALEAVIAATEADDGPTVAAHLQELAAAVTDAENAQRDLHRELTPEDEVADAG